MNKKDDALNQINKDEDAHALLNRKEEKYFLPRRHLEKVVSELSERFIFGDIDTDTRHCRNRTIYLDDLDLSSFKDSIAKKTPRVKVRIRQYSPNDMGWESVAYAEFKLKDEDDESKKIRVRIPSESIDSLASGGKIHLDENLININRDLDRHLLEKRVDAINNSIEKRGLKKQVEVQYDRRAYTGKNLRITIDDNLKFLDASPINETIKSSLLTQENWRNFVEPYLFASWENPIVLEVKSQEESPKWMKRLLKEVEAEKTSFSKYSAAIVANLKTSQSSGAIFGNSLLEESITKSEETQALEPIKKIEDIKSKKELTLSDIRETIDQSPLLKKEHGKAVYLSDAILVRYIKDNPQLNELVEKAYKELRSK